MGLRSRQTLRLSPPSMGLGGTHLDLVHEGPGKAPEERGRGTGGSCLLIAVSRRDSAGILPTVSWRWLGACLLIAVGRRDSAGMHPDFVHNGPERSGGRRERGAEGGTTSTSTRWTPDLGGSGRRTWGEQLRLRRRGEQPRVPQQGPRPHAAAFRPGGIPRGRAGCVSSDHSASRPVDPEEQTRGPLTGAETC